MVKAMKQLWNWFARLFSSERCVVCGDPSHGDLMCEECAELSQTFGA